MELDEPKAAPSDDTTDGEADAPAVKSSSPKVKGKIKSKIGGKKTDISLDMQEVKRQDSDVRPSQYLARISLTLRTG